MAKEGVFILDARIILLLIALIILGLYGASIYFKCKEKRRVTNFDVLTLMAIICFAFGCIETLI